MVLGDFRRGCREKGGEIVESGKERIYYYQFTLLTPQDFNRCVDRRNIRRFRRPTFNFRTPQRSSSWAGGLPGSLKFERTNLVIDTIFIL